MLTEFLDQFEVIRLMCPHINENHLFINFLRSKLGLDPIGYNGFNLQK